jgi:ribosomal protein L37AE/L43A
VGRTTSGATGAYFLRLPPGTYTLVGEPIETAMVAPSSPVTVTAGAPATLNLVYDTGIR